MVTRPLLSLGLAMGLFIPCYAGDPLGPADRDDLLKSLHDCLAKMPKYVSRQYILPCAGRDVSSLKGMTIAALSAAIGPPNFCIGPNSGRFQLTESACPEGASPQWSFYRWPKKVTAGGPELRCVLDATDSTVCAGFKWLYSH